MEKILVDSSSISYVSYEPILKTLEVRFQNGGTYHYFNVSRKIYEAFLNSPSKSAFLNYIIKGKYRYIHSGSVA